MASLAFLVFAASVVFATSAGLVAFVAFAASAAIAPV